MAIIKRAVFPGGSGGPLLETFEWDNRIRRGLNHKRDSYRKSRKKIRPDQKLDPYLQVGWRTQRGWLNWFIPYNILEWRLGTYLYSYFIVVGSKAYSG